MKTVNYSSYKEVDRCFTVPGFYTYFDFHWSDNYTFNGESHDFWEIVFVRHGRVEVTEDENIYVLNKNDIILHAPLEFHRIKNCPDCESDVTVTSFRVTGELPEVLRKGVFSLGHEEKDTYLTVAHHISAFLNSGSPTDGQEASDLLSSFLLQLSRAVTTPSEIDSGTARVYRELVSDMAERICENLTLEDFSKEHSVSISYIKFLFSTYAGISPKAYFRRLRTQYAIKLLEEGASISSVSEKMNFSSPNYFSSFFKSQTGLTPSQYAAQNLPGQGLTD